MSTVEASAKLNALFKVPSLTVEYKTINDDSVAIRNIVKTTPMAGEKIKNTGKVIIYISAGPDKNVIVPSLFGLSLEDARSKLESRGLKVGEVTYQTNSNFTPGTVLKQSHTANNTIEKGSKIDLVVNKAEEIKTNTPAPTTEAPEVEYNVIVVYTGSVEDLFKEDAKDDDKITITGRIRYNGRDYTATDTISKASYELNGETEITFSIRSSTPVKDEDIQAYESSSISGASKDGAVAKVKGFSVMKVN
jgi:beta-lactam-binding protein with PASTA domain